MAQISVTNRSDWPDWLIKWAVREACRDAGIKQYSWVQKSMSVDRGYWWGRGGWRSGYGAAKRRSIKPTELTRYTMVDSRFKDAPTETYPHTPIAMLLFLIRHEVAHAKGAEGYPGDFVGANGRERTADMEDACNEAAGRFVRRLEAEWSQVLSQWLTIARKERSKMKAQRERRKTAKADKNAMMLAAWNKRLKLAQTKVKKYKARVMSQERRRLAATKQR